MDDEQSPRNRARSTLFGLHEHSRADVVGKSMQRRFEIGLVCHLKIDSNANRFKHSTINQN